MMIFNQFEEFGNYLWHFEVTGQALGEVLTQELSASDTYRGLVLATGSAGTLASGDYLKQIFPGSKIAASEAWQCPTLLENGFGEHRIEGIGDKHVPWIHNVANTDLLIGIDDTAVVRLARLFNEPEGRSFLRQRGTTGKVIEQLDLLGFSGICNLISSIKFAKYYELGHRDVVLTCLTDSMELYGSRIEEMRTEKGEYTPMDAAADYSRYLQGITTDGLQELSYTDRRRVHNLKYFTWVEQQGCQSEELHAQWYDRDYWTRFQRQVSEIDSLIEEFNHRVGIKS
jgi:hypothetical protein